MLIYKPDSSVKVKKVISLPASTKLLVVQASISKIARRVVVARRNLTDNIAESRSIILRGRMRTKFTSNFPICD